MPAPTMDPTPVTTLTTTKTLQTYDALAVIVPQGEAFDAGVYATGLTEDLADYLTAQWGEAVFTGKAGTMLTAYGVDSAHGVAACFGVGETNQKKMTDVKKAVSAAVGWARGRKAKTLGIVLPTGVCRVRTLKVAAHSNYEFKVGDRSEIDLLEAVEVVREEGLPAAELTRVRALTQAVSLTRDLVNLPANMMTPMILVNAAKEALAGSPVKITIYDKAKLEEMGFYAALEVGRGSDEPSAVAVMEYTGAGSDVEPMAFVGKGVTFDAGGYNLKPTGYIESMKCDMGGAASVVGLMKYLSVAQPKTNVIGVIGCVENLISGHAYKPGDIIRSLSGKTICITNTDAEGRLVLADCLHYVTTELKPRMVFDVATLTGAAVVALGERMTAVMTNRQELCDQVRALSAEVDEPTWQLPITDFFREKTKSKTSDLQNWTAGVRAGASMAGAFLENFVNDTPWVHFDIAGTAFEGKYGTGNGEKGATGTIVATFAAMAEQL